MFLYRQLAQFWMVWPLPQNMWIYMNLYRYDVLMSTKSPLRPSSCEPWKLGMVPHPFFGPARFPMQTLQYAYDTISLQSFVYVNLDTCILVIQLVSPGPGAGWWQWWGWRGSGPSSPPPAAPCTLPCGPGQMPKVTVMTLHGQFSYICVHDRYCS